MSGLAVAAAGLGSAGAGLYLARARHPRIDRVLKQHAPIVKKGLVHARRDALFAHGAVRAQFARAFFAVSHQYAPVPLTFIKAAMGSYWAIFSTALGGCVPALKKHFGGEDKPAAWNLFARNKFDKVERERHEDFVLAVALVAAGVVLYGIGKVAWGRGPLRGGLSVFGACPHLDRCASQERYLAEKLAEFSNMLGAGARAAPRGLHALGNLGAEDGAVAETVNALSGYAKRAGALATPEISTCWRRYVMRVDTHRAEMKSITNKLKFPMPGGDSVPEANLLLRVVRPTEPVRRFVRSSKDVAQVFGNLVQDLGANKTALLQGVPNAAAFGFVAGCEADAWLPPDAGQRVRRQLKRWNMPGAK